MIKNINKIIIIIFVLFIAGCISNINQEWREESNGWIIAKDQYGVPTKIQYSIITAYSRGEFYAYGVSLYNGYDKPLEIYYKVYFNTSNPGNYNQYLYTNKKLDWIGFGPSEPVKVETIKLEDR